MTDDNNTAFDANQIDEDVLTYTASDEALEAAAGFAAGALAAACADRPEQVRSLVNSFEYEE
jgi:hypothetical protein